VEPIDAVFDGISATVRANAHGTDPGMVVVAIGGALGGGLELTANNARRLMYQLSCAHVKAMQLADEQRDQAREYAHA
jgi:hypothetical protein